MKMLMFDFRKSEKEFFEKREFKDIDITFIKEPLNNETYLSDEQLNQTDIISTFINSDLTAEVLNKFKNLRIIATRSSGYNHIDTEYCIKNHIAVFNVPKYGETSVAQYTVALMLTLIRNLIPAYTDMQRGIICHSKYEGRNLNEMVLGIIGCGAIGSVVAKTAYFLGMKVLVCSYEKQKDVEGFATYVGIDELFNKSDVISLHLPLTPESYHILGENEFNKMKDGTFIINTARGELIDIVALYKSVLSGKIKGAALDVLECEYTTKSDSRLINDIKDENSKCITNALVTQKLLAMENVIITPHIAYNTKESVDKLLEVTFSNILNHTKGEHLNRVC